MQKISIKDNFESFINDPGIQLNHPNKENLLLEDIFIFPELKHTTDKIISSKELLKINDNENKIIISGYEDSGKTTLIKVLIKHYLESGYYPIYIDTENFTVLDSQELLEIIYKEYEEAYDKDTYNYIRAESKHKKAVFVDNFDKLNTSSTVMSEILNDLHTTFDNVILTEKTQLNIISDSQLKMIFPELATGIKHYEIMEFSSELRLQLIRKWNFIGPEKESDIKDFALEVERTKEVIDTVIGHNLVPSYPIFLLTILQMNNHDEDGLTSGSSYGHYHEYLIIKSLQKSIEKESVYNYLDFLSKLSFYMFDKQKEEVSYKELSSVFNTSLINSLTCSDVIERLLTTDTLILEEPLYKFRYRYTYHYFVAKYLSENINSESIKDTIKKLCSKLNNDGSANIILFITHHTQETFIVNELIGRAELVFSNIEDISMEEESTEIDGLIEELSKLGTRDRKLKEPLAEYSGIKRERELNFRDKRESLNSANNLIRIVKQILKKGTYD